MPAGNMKELRRIKREAKLGLLNESRGIGMFEPVTVTVDGHPSISWMCQRNKMCMIIFCDLPDHPGHASTNAIVIF